MEKQAETMEWVVAESDAEWEQICTPSILEMRPGEAAASPDRSAAWRILTGYALALLLLSGAGAWGGRALDAELPAGEAHATPGRKLPVVAQRDGRLTISKATGQGDEDWWHQLAREYDGLLAATQTAAPDEHLDAALRDVEFHDDQALATVVMYRGDGSRAYRQTRFYRRTDAGWQGVAPEASLWGAERSLETPSFIFHFRQRDAAAVIAVAPQVEALYGLMGHNLGLDGAPDAQKLVVDVRVMQPPGYAAPWYGTPAQIIVPSPALYLAPVELTDAELLAQSLALPLLEHVLVQDDKHHAIPTTWQPLRGALRLWQLWELDLPLAAWREEVIRWIYVDLPANPPGQTVVLPPRYRELCAAHLLWLQSPIQIHLPLFCTDQDQVHWYFYWQKAFAPPVRLDQLTGPVALESTDYGYPPGWLLPSQTIALVTLIDYAVATYGRERLPLLLASLGQHESWETLIPAVYGVSAADFEAGWQADLAARYDVSVHEEARISGKE